MKTMTSKERFSRMFSHQEADRVPVLDYPWQGTLARWRREGLPDGMSYVDYFGLDKVAHFNVDNSPGYPQQVLEETDKYRIYTTSWGATLKSFKQEDSTPEFIDFTITNPDKWREAKERMKPTPDKVNWKLLETNYKKWQDEGYWIVAGLWFGFDVTHSWTVGTERLLMALIEDPEWCSDMFNHFLDVNLALLDMVWDAGYRFDCVRWPDDMGYKNNQFFSVKTYRELIKPVHKRAIDWAHDKGIKSQLHSCGDVNPFIPEFIDIGLDSLNPLEIKAGMDPTALKKKYGDKLVFHGGINAVLWENPSAIEEEMRKVIPVMKQSGGYIFSSDHSIPNSVSFKNFERIICLYKELGQY